MRLIFVEDDADIRALVVECLFKRGYEVIAAATAEAAMQLLIALPAPSLVVTDIDLGAGRSGIELADWLHEQWPELHVIFASSCLDRLDNRAPDTRETYLAKPFRVCKLIELMRDAVHLCAPANSA